MTQRDYDGPVTPVVIVDNEGQRGFAPVEEVDNDFTGIITIAVAGTAVTGPNTDSTTGFFLKGHPDNTDTVWYFPRGRTKANGFPLNAGEPIFVNVKNLSVLSFDTDVNGGKMCWSKA